MTDTATAARTARVRGALDAMAKAGDAVTISALARRARVSRQFLYRHPELRAEALRHQAADDQAGADGRRRDNITVASLKVELAHAEDQDRRLRATLARLEARLSYALGAEVAAEAGLSTADDVRALRSQVAGLEGDEGQLTSHGHFRLRIFDDGRFASTRSTEASRARPYGRSRQADSTGIGHQPPMAVTGTPMGRRQDPG